MPHVIAAANGCEFAEAQSRSPCPRVSRAPSLSVTPSLAPPEGWHAEGVGAVDAFQVAVPLVVIADDRQPVRAVGGRGARADMPDAVQDGLDQPLSRCWSSVEQ